MFQADCRKPEGTSEHGKSTENPTCAAVSFRARGDCVSALSDTDPTQAHFGGGPEVSLCFCLHGGRTQNSTQK